MSENIQVQKYTGSDGRRVEQKIIERIDSGKKQRIVETHVEQVPVALEERVIETIVPVVTERKRELYTAGQLVDTHVEKVADESLQMKNHVEKQALTKEDIAEAFKSAMLEVQQEQTPMPLKAVRRPVRQVVEEDEQEAIEQPKRVPTPKGSIADNVSKKLSNLPSWTDYIFYVIILGNAAFVIYQLFLKNYF